MDESREPWLDEDREESEDQNPEMDSEVSLETLRREIDRIDDRILRLLSGRVILARQVGRIKADNDLPVLDRAREEAVIARVLTLPHKPLDSLALERIYRLIIEICRESQEKNE